MTSQYMWPMIISKKETAKLYLAVYLFIYLYLYLIWFVTWLICGSVSRCWFLFNICSDPGLSRCGGLYWFAWAGLSLWFCQKQMLSKASLPKRRTDHYKSEFRDLLTTALFKIRRLYRPLVSIALEYSGHAARQWNPVMFFFRQKFAQWPL